MKRRFISLMHLLLIVACAVTLGGCEQQQELCFEHENHDRQPLDVVFDWGEEPDADPVTMSLYLFPQDGRRSLRYEFEGGKGGRIMVPCGRYTAIAVNSDTEAAKTRYSESLSTFEVWLNDVTTLSPLSVASYDVPRAPGAEYERIVSASDPIWSDRQNDVVVRVNDAEVQQLTMCLRDVVCHYSIEVRNVKNLRDVAALDATISGMSGSMRLSDYRISSERVSIPFNLLATGEALLEGQWLTFGHCGISRGRSRLENRAAESRNSLPDYDPYDYDIYDHNDQENRHHVTVYAVLVDGTRWYHSFDVTDQVHDSPAARCHIVIDGLELPQAAVTGGFGVVVDNWSDIEEEIPM